MKESTLNRRTVQKGNRQYIEIEGANYKLITAKEKLTKGQFKGISKKNQLILLNFITDLENGRYTSKGSVKGARSKKRLLKLIYTLIVFSKWFNNTLFTDITETQVQKVFEDLNGDKIRRLDGKPYKDKRDFKKDFSTFWKWHMIKTHHEKNQRLVDITEYIHTPKESRPKFVYFTLHQLKDVILQNTNNEDLKALLFILFDTGARPSEFYNIRRKDITFSEKHNRYLLDIPEETSKTYGRKIILMLSSDMLRRYLERHQFQPDDPVFIMKQGHVKKFIWEVNKVDDVCKITMQYEKTLTLYDFRHASACYYLDRYKSAKDMKYRYGWKKESEIEYYTGFLGKQDIITEEDLLNPEDKTELQKKVVKLEKDLALVNKIMKNPIVLKELARQAEAAHERD